jgi:hypothetical protein
MADVRWHGDMMKPSPYLPWYKGWASEVASHMSKIVQCPTVPKVVDPRRFSGQVAGKNVRSKNVRVKNVRPPPKNVRWNLVRGSGRFCKGHPFILPPYVPVFYFIFVGLIIDAKQLLR